MVFDRADDGSNVYTVDVLNTRTTFQINREFALRAIVQYDSSKKQVLTDFLGSWELLPGTVAYAGYGSLIEERGWNGSEWTDGPALVLPHVAARLLLQGLLHPPLLTRLHARGSVHVPGPGHPSKIVIALFAHCDGLRHDALATQEGRMRSRSAVWLRQPW